MADEPAHAAWQLALPGAAAVLLLLHDVVRWGDVTADQVTAFATAAQAAGVLAALVVAGRQLGEARRQREEQSRPQVVVDLDHERFQFPYLVIENVGAAVATNVRFEIDPPLVSTAYDPETAIGEIGVLREGIPTLPPRRPIRILFEHAPDRYQRRDELPTRHTIKATYNSPIGGPYEGTFVLDLELYWHIRRTEEKGLREVANYVERIAKQLEKWDDHGTLHMRTDEDVERRNREFMEDRARRLAEHKARLEGGDE